MIAKVILETLPTAFAYMLAGMFLEQRYHPIDKLVCWIARIIENK